MKNRIYCKTAFLAGLWVILPFTGYSENPIPAPSVLPTALISASIPDLHKTIDVIQAYADQILPEGDKIDLKAQVGTLIGDPELKSIPAGSGAAVIWDGSTWYAVLECDPQAPSVTQLIQITESMQVMSSIQDNLFILSKNQVGLDAGNVQAKLAADTLLKNERVGGIVTLQLAELMTRFDPQIKMGLTMMPLMMMQTAAQMPEAEAKSMQGMAKFVEGELRVLISLASQVAFMEIAIRPGKDGVELSETLSFKEGSNLQTLFSAPDVLKPDPLINASILEPGMMAIEMFMGNPEAMQAFLKAETDLLVTGMSLDPEVTAQWMEMVQLWPSLFSGSMAETVRMDGEKGFSVDYLSSVQDGAAALSLFESLPDMMTPFTEMYKNMGMPMDMEMKMHARSYKNAAIHQYNFSYDLAQMDPAIAEQFKSMNLAEMNSEFTVINNRILWTMGESPLDRLIDKVEKAEVPISRLHARTVYPAGGLMYFDLNLGDYIAFIANLMPMDPMKTSFSNIAKEFSESEPLTSATYKQEQLFHASMHLPSAILIKGIKLGFTGYHESLEYPLPQENTPAAPIPAAANPM